MYMFITVQLAFISLKSPRNPLTSTTEIKLTCKTYYRMLTGRCADLGVFPVVEVSAKAEVLQVDGLLFAFVYEARHLLRRGNLEGSNTTHDQLKVQRWKRVEFSPNHFHSCSSLPCRYSSKLASPMHNSLCLVHFGWSYRWGPVVQGHEARRCVSQNGEVRCGWGAHGQRATVSVNLVVHQTPLLQERMNPADRQQSHLIHMNSFFSILIYSN